MIYEKNLKQSNATVPLKCLWIEGLLIGSSSIFTDAFTFIIECFKSQKNLLSSPL